MAKSQAVINEKLGKVIALQGKDIKYMRKTLDELVIEVREMNKDYSDAINSNKQALGETIIRVGNVEDNLQSLRNRLWAVIATVLGVIISAIGSVLLR